MSIPPDRIILKGDDLLITPIPRNVSWLITTQRDTPNDRRVADYLSKVKALPLGAPLPEMEPLDMNFGQTLIADKGWLIMVKMGQQGKGGPNDTEFELLKLMNKYGRKVRREAANG